ncbi:hypothetical protein SPBR_00013 [Sporothrix brasiliensis 5110]|uniref:chitinase n=1 Tax=Sporothrix brasiliensis 5110 TaxID=1398154 RepID=A0A0C2ILD3_9PEZI|nr:uncharacterized protein SPBR_00013 [Sporothrix brasiliensis 5110]KIH89906.1 hypothetical protein SPBR_00013 [Sporothrix brasiliensis 5110]
MPKAVGGNSASGRKIGYWQSSNVHKRQYKDGKFKCPPVRPGDIPLDTNIPLGGRWTHLYYAFGAINPKTFHIVDDPAKAPLYTEFTALKYRPNGPQTWIAVGGFDFSDPGVDPDAETDTAPDVSTHSTWSDMAMTTDRRTAFIQSLIAFMDKYGFQGIDLDWEYPVSEDRGGRPEDTENFVSLVREMRQVFGTKYGISVALAPDFWYLRYFDAVAMQPYVDWFGFMAYDLHGVWASDSKSKLVRGHTDADEIYKDIIPLSFGGLDFKKINFGMAIYGRGFTLADPKCRAMDGACSWTGGNEAGICTDFSGVLSYDEIQQKILDAQRQNRPGPTLDPTTMMKYLTWGDKQQNWIGYDDQETWQLKKTNLADKFGFGGTMFWSVDFMGQGMNISDVYIDPALVCQDGNTGNRIASCHQPCRLIMPQCAIPTTTVTATYTITFEVYQVTTASISFSPVYVGGGRNGVTLPNWPTTGQWPPPGGVTNQDPWQAPTHSDASSSTSTQEPFAPPPPLYPITGPTDPPVPKETVFRTTEKTETTSTTTAAAVIMTWPPGVIEPTDNDDDDIIPCHAWFLTGFKLNFPIPPGLYIFPPPDPPAIKPPPGVNIDLKPEPHITLTRGKDNKWTTPQRSDQTSSCAHSTTVYDTAISVTATRNVCPDIKDDRFWNDAKYWNAISTTDDNDKGQAIEWQPGEPGPLCSAAAPSTTPSKGSGRGTLPPELNGRAPQIVLGPGQCGAGCNSDWYCDDSPDGVPPFYRDPKDPNKGNPYLGILPVPIPIPTPLPSTAPQVRHCHFHITKIFTYDPNNANTVLGTKNIGTASGNKLVWSASQSRLPADIHFALSSCLVPRSMNFRRGVDGTDDTDSTDSVDGVDSADGTDGVDGVDGSDDTPLESDNCVITFTTSGHTWSTDDRDSSKAAYCNVGKYSGHLTQDMDCFYTC